MKDVRLHCGVLIESSEHEAPCQKKRFARLESILFYTQDRAAFFILKKDEHLDELMVIKDSIGKAGIFCIPNQIIDAVAAEKVDRKSTRLNSSHSQISYAVFCLKK